MREGQALWPYLPSLFFPVLEGSSAQRVLLNASFSSRMARTVFLSVISELLLL